MLKYTLACFVFVIFVISTIAGTPATYSARLVWNHVSLSASNELYRVYERKHTNWVLVGKVSPTTNSFDLSIPYGSSRMFVVTSSNSVWGESTFSNIAGTPARETPTNLRLYK